MTYFQRAAAAFLAIFFRSSADRLWARAFDPARPDRVRPDFGALSSTSPVAIRMYMDRIADHVGWALLAFGAPRHWLAPLAR